MIGKETLKCGRVVGKGCGKVTTQLQTVGVDDGSLFGLVSGRCR